MTRSGPQRTDIGKPDARIRPTLHASEGDHVRRGPKGVASHSKSCTRARMSRARVTASIDIPVVFSSRQRRIDYPLRPADKRRTKGKVPSNLGKGAAVSAQ